MLGKLRRGDIVVTARLDRLTRSLADFASLMDGATRRRWNFVALDLGVTRRHRSGASSRT